MNTNPETSAWSKLTTAALVLAAATVIARATFVETLRDPQLVTPGADAVPRGAGPTASLILDLLLCLPALLILLRRLLDKDFRLRLGISQILFLVLAILAAASTFWSSDKFSALLTSSQLLAAAVLMWSMTQLARTWLHVRLVAGICFGLILVYATQGIFYRFVDQPDNIKFWQEHKDDELRRRGWEPDSFAAQQFEKKLISGEMMGFNTSPNSFAAMIVLLGIVVAGAAVQRFKDKDESGFAGMMIVGLIAAAYISYYTDCRTALATPFIAAGILICTPWVAPRRRFFYWLGFAAVLLVTALLVGHGLYHGTLFHDSLTFRWRYWIGAARVFRQHPILGVGWSNFGAYYLGVRLPIASEEIKDPHNFVVRVFVELGVVGGILILSWLARVWWEMIAQVTPAWSMHRPRHSDKRETIFLVGAICVLGILINVFCSVDFTLGSPDVAWYVGLEIFKRLLFLVLLVLGIIVGLLPSSKTATMDDRPAPWILWAIITGIAIFLLHNLIDFSLFEPGPMGLFAMLVGTVLGIRSGEGEGKLSPTYLTLCGLSVAAVVWLAALFGIIVPVGTAESLAHQGDEQLRTGSARDAGLKLRDAFNALWISNGDYAYRSAVAMQEQGWPANEVEPMLQKAVDADPMSPKYKLALADYDMHKPQPDPRAVIANYEKAIALNPNEVATHRDFAAILAQFGQRQRAIEEYQTALAYNDQLDPHEPKRLSSAQIDEIQRQIKSLKN